MYPLEDQYLASQCVVCQPAFKHTCSVPSQFYALEGSQLLPVHYFPKIPDQMLLYSELGRHTPPPPPYPKSKRNTPKAKSSNETSQVPAPPPPPPPYLSSAPKHDCRLPSMDELRRQAVIIDDPYLCHNGNAIPRPSVPTQQHAAQVFSSHTTSKDYSGTWELDRSRLKVPAHPIEPRWTPAGVLGYPGPPIGLATAPLPKLPLGGLNHLMPQGCTSGPRARARPGHKRGIPQSTGIGCLGHTFPSCATHAPMYTRPKVSAMGQKRLPTPRKRSSKVDAWLASANISQITAPLETTKYTCPMSALPPQQALEERTTLSQASASQGVDAVARRSDVNSLVILNDGSSSDGDSSDENDGSNRAAMVREGQYYPSPAPVNYESGISKDYTMHRGQDSGHHVQHFSTRRPSASARFAPYQQRQPKAAERMGQRLKVREDGGKTVPSN